MFLRLFPLFIHKSTHLLIYNYFPAHVYSLRVLRCQAEIPEVAILPEPFSETWEWLLGSVIISSSVKSVWRHRTCLVLGVWTTFVSVTL